MTTYQDILFSQEAGVAKVTLNRPSVLNALSPNLIAELADVARKVSWMNLLRCLSLRGLDGHGRQGLT